MTYKGKGVLFMLDRMKWTSIAYSILYIAAGILLLLYPGKMGELFCDLFGIALIIYGIISIVMYFMMDIRLSLFRNDFASGIIKILLGVMVIYHKDVFQSLIPFLLAIALIASGILKLQNGVDVARIGYPNSWQFLVLAAISIIAGILIMFNLIPSAELMLQVAGGALLYSGLTDLYTTLYLSGKIKKFMEAREKPKPPVVQSPKEEPVPEEEESTAAYVDWNTTATGMSAIREELSAPVTPAVPEIPSEKPAAEPVEEEQKEAPAETSSEEPAEPSAEDSKEEIK